MGGVIEEPGEEVGWDIEKGGENGDEREIGNGGAEVAAGEKCETDGGESREEVVRVLAVPAITGEDVHTDSDGEEADDEEEERDKRKTEVEEDERASPATAGAGDAP